MFVGGILVGIAWALNSVASDLSTLYIAAAIGGIGAGAVYGTSIGNALKWFPDRRGLAAGLTAAGFGAGSALTIIPIQGMIQSSGYQATFLWFGIGQGVVVVVLSLLLRAPQPGRDAGFDARAAVGAGLRAVGSVGVTDLLGDVCDVRSGRRGRPDGDGAAGADRRRLPGRQGPGAASSA